ncbi:MAG: SH3 domain-containing protein [Alphaproteobacteria bacterium]|jgi:SH3-like domain-containing protein
MQLIFSLFIVLILAAPTAFAANKAAHPGASGLSTPRFVSLASATVHMRAGPGVRYPITWVYKRLGTPFMVMAEHEYWRKVRDLDGTEGWMHSSLLSGRRTAVLRAQRTALRQQPNESAPIVLRAEAGVIGKLLACKKAWCRMDIADISAWLPRVAIFGALPNEQF